MPRRSNRVAYVHSGRTATLVAVLRTPRRHRHGARPATAARRAHPRPATARQPMELTMSNRRKRVIDCGQTGCGRDATIHVAAFDNGGIVHAEQWLCDRHAAARDNSFA